MNYLPEAEAYIAERENRRTILREAINQLTNLSFESSEQRLESCTIKRNRDGVYKISITTRSDFYV